MNDLNFFYEFNQEKRKRTISITVFLFAILVVFGGAMISVLYLDKYISNEKMKIDKQNKIVISNKRIKLESDFEDISVEERRLQQSLTQIQSIRAYVAGLNKITTEKILRVFNELPKNVNISSFECNQGGVSMECESLDRRGVASTINNLKRLGLEEVYVPSIVTLDNEGVTTYRFCISAKMQEEKNHEND